MEFAPERRLTSKTLRKAIQEHNIFQPNTTDMDEHVPVLSIADIRTIAQQPYPEIHLSEESISTKEIEIVINAITSQTITPEE